jgi:hypothetical protein
VTTQVSPDTGTTTNTYDSGGNLAISTDARSAISTYVYDALNRATSVAYKKGTTTDQTIVFTGWSELTEPLELATSNRGNRIKLQPPLSRPDLRQPSGTALELLQRLRPGHRQIRGERSHRASGWKSVDVCLCRGEPNQQQRSPRIMDTSGRLNCQFPNRPFQLERYLRRCG